MKPIFRKMSLALAMAAGLGPAHAGVLTYQDVVFTTTWTNNVLTLEIDAARHSGDWSRATMLGALSLKDIGSYSSVSLTAAPQGVSAWKMTSKELNANGCAGGGRSKSTSALCLSGAPIALTDNMVFSFTFTGGTPDLDEPHLKVNFTDGSKYKLGDLLSKIIKSIPVVATPPVVKPPPVVTAPPVVTPPVVTPPPVVTTPVVTAPPIETPPPVVPPPAETSPVPVPPPLLSTPPVLELEPVSGTAPSTNEVPEPYTIALLLGGLALMGAALRKRR